MRDDDRRLRTFSEYSQVRNERKKILEKAENKNK